MTSGATSPSNRSRMWPAVAATMAGPAGRDACARERVADYLIREPGASVRAPHHADDDSGARGAFFQNADRQIGGSNSRDRPCRAAQVPVLSSAWHRTQVAVPDAYNDSMQADGPRRWRAKWRLSTIC